MECRSSRRPVTCCAALHPPNPPSTTGTQGRVRFSSTHILAVFFFCEPEGTASRKFSPPIGWQHARTNQDTGFYGHGSFWFVNRTRPLTQCCCAHAPWLVRDRDRTSEVQTFISVVESSEATLGKKRQVKNCDKQRAQSSGRGSCGLGPHSHPTPSGQCTVPQAYRSRRSPQRENTY